MPSANYRWNLSLVMWQITITLSGETPQIHLFYISNLVYLLKFSSQVSSTPTHWTQQSLTVSQTQFSLTSNTPHKRFQKSVACHPQLLVLCVCVWNRDVYGSFKFQYVLIFPSDKPWHTFEYSQRESFRLWRITFPVSEHVADITV